jgi:hypothetical protein
MSNPKDVKYLTANQVQIDTEVNRYYEDARAKEMGQNFSLERAAKSGLVVSERPNGVFIALDGQHRFGGAKYAGFGDVPLPVMVMTGLTPEEEAEWVLLFQEDRRATSPAESHRLGVKAGRPLDVAISQICSKYGLRLTGFKGQNSIAAISTVKSVAKKPGGFQTLDSALSIVTGAWNGEPASFEAPVLRGVSAVISKHQDSIDTAALIKKLSKQRPSKLIARANSNAEDLNIAKWRAFGNVVIGLYNSHRAETSRLSEI